MKGNSLEIDDMIEFQAANEKTPLCLWVRYTVTFKVAKNPHQTYGALGPHIGRAFSLASSSFNMSFQVNVGEHYPYWNMVCGDVIFL